MSLDRRLAPKWDHTSPTAELHRRLPVVAIVFLSMLAYAAVRTPLPGANEPHYLAKAKHHWNPQWCPGDLFLDSANAHLVFYQTVGALTCWLTLEQTAWVGRVAAYLVLAAGWTALAASLLPGRWTGVWSLWTYLAVVAVGNLSGEWIVGGVEAKSFSYGLLFAALAGAVRGRWWQTGIWAGLAMSFHPVVGGWAAAAAAWAVLGSGGILTAARDDRIQAAGLRSQLVPAAILLILFALPGIVPALGLLGSGSIQADAVQVFVRLPHHLLPPAFPVSGYVGYGLLVIAWSIARRRAEFSGDERWFAWFVTGIALIALCGLVAGWQAEPNSGSLLNVLRIKFLKLYPFRLFDSLMPLAFAFAVACLVQNRLSDGAAATAARRGRSRRTIAWVVFGGLMGTSLLLPASESNPSRMPAKRLADWHDACRWISSHTPADALFLTPTNESWAFHWYAHRSAYVIYKDCPQDAVGILEWDRRLEFVRRWIGANSPRGFSAADLSAFRETTGVTHILTRQFGPFELQPIYRNRTYRLYQVPAAGTGQTTEPAGEH